MDAGVDMMFPHQELARQIGSALVSPSARITETGDYAPSVSIRRGRGSATLDKVYRFTRRFANQRSAIDYAMHQGQLLAAA